jgi:hypothetical protein
MSKENDKSLSTSPQLVFVEQHRAVVALSQKELTSLYKKSKQSGIPFDTLEEVYRRGYAMWAPSMNETPEQHAFARVNSFIAEGAAAAMDSDLTEKKRGLWDNIHAKRERIKRGSGERMRKPGSKGAPTDADFKAASEAYTGTEKVSKNPDMPANRFDATDSLVNNYKKSTPGQTKLKTIKKVVKEMYECDCDGSCMMQQEEIEEDAKGHKSPSGGLTKKGRDYYNRTTGSNLKAPVTTKPSKLKAGSKAANRRKSFCARMGGMKKRLTSSKTANDPDSRINKALRKWNC